MAHGTSVSDDGSFTLAGHGGALVARRWPAPAEPQRVVLLAHGYGEHIGRYDAVAARLTAAGAAVHGVDHVGHGRSDGERVLITDYEDVVADLALLHDAAAADHPGLPVALIGHSMGGMIAARYAQRHADRLAALVLSGPVLGRWDPVVSLLAHEEIPDTPIDPDTLSRDPAVGRAYVEDPLVWHGPFKRPTIEAMVAALGLIAAGGRPAVPALYLHGEADTLVPIEASLEGWAAIARDDAETVTYPGARHEIFNETNREQVLDDVIAFLARHA